jgi:hypothetical protein
VPTQPRIRSRLYYDTRAVFSAKEELMRSLMTLVFPPFQFFGIVMNIVPVDSQFVAFAHDPFMNYSWPARLVP